MALQESKVLTKISRDAMLWRYMTLDKLINLLTTNRLFFAPLYSYQKSDPFEGVLPRIGRETLREIFLSGYEDRLLILTQFRNILLEKATGQPEELAQIKKVEEVIAQVENHPSLMEKISFRIFKSTLVNCWHQNEFESEAMWRLYSENNKGIAIQTTLQNLVDSIDDQRIFLSEVKYINFSDEKLEPKDLLVNGHLSPLLKRKSFEHEKELRLFLQPENDLKSLSVPNYHYKHELIEVDISKLISKIYISPYATELFANSVKEVMRRFGIDENKIIHSDLLKLDADLEKYLFD